MQKKYQDCRINILQNFEISPVDSSIIKIFIIKPKVVNVRLILLAKYVLYIGSLRDAVKKDYDNTISLICAEVRELPQ